MTDARKAGAQFALFAELPIDAVAANLELTRGVAAAHRSLRDIGEANRRLPLSVGPGIGTIGNKPCLENFTDLARPRAGIPASLLLGPADVE